MELTEIDRKILLKQKSGEFTNAYSCHRYPEITAPLGAFIMQWSVLENMLIFPLYVGLPTKAQEIISGLLYSLNSTETKISMVKSVIDNLPDDRGEKKKIQLALKRIAGLCPERNALCHHVWSSDLVSKEFCQFDHRKRGAAKRKNITPDYISKLTEKVMQSAQDLIDACGGPPVAITDERMLSAIDT